MGKRVIFQAIGLIACLHDQNKSGFFGGPAFIQPIRVIGKVSKSRDGWKKAGPPKKLLHVNSY